MKFVLESLDGNERRALRDIHSDDEACAACCVLDALRLDWQIVKLTDEQDWSDKLPDDLFLLPYFAGGPRVVYCPRSGL